MIKGCKTFATLSLGCRVNKAEIDDYSAHLISLGYKIVPIDIAELIVVNTCTVTAVADKKSRKAIRKILSYGPKCIFVTGCAALLNKDFYEDMDDKIKFFSKKELLDFTYDGLAKILSRNSFRTRVSIKIQDGCDNACTYCIVHVARGPACSVDPDIVVKRYNDLCNAGIKEVVLTGVDLGAYKYGLTKLLKQLDGSARIRLSSIEPNNINDELIEYLQNSNVCKYLHLPLQSGSDKILSAMNRKYSAREYFDLVYKLKAKIPGIALSTDIIVGFPGESDDDFKQTLELSKQCGFMKIHVFPYSVRPNTPAATMKNQLSAATKNKRAKILRDLSNDLAHKDLLSRKGMPETLLIENEKVARCESYHLVHAPKNSEIGSLVPVVL